MNLFDIMEKRRSVRRYWPDPVPRAKLEKLIEAAMLAPTGFNKQGWVFVAVDDPATKKQVADACKWGGFIAQAGACIAIFYDKSSSLLVEDSAAAAENIILAAVAEGLGTCWVNSHHLEHAAEIERLLGCPQTHELTVLLAVGVPDGKTDKPSKKFIAEVLRWNKF